VQDFRIFKLLEHNLIVLAVGADRITYTGTERLYNADIISLLGSFFVI